MDEEIKAAEDAINESNAEGSQEQGEENIPEESPTTEEIAGEEESQEEGVATESESEEFETEESPKKGAEKRIKQLVKEKNEAEQQAKSLADRLAEITEQGNISPQGQYQSPQQQQDEPIVQPGEEIDAFELDRRIRERENRLLQQMEARSELRNRQTEAVNRINSESQKAIAKYGQLNPDSVDFDKELSETITEAAEALVRQNPYSASVEKFVDKLMKPYVEGVTREVGKERENIAKQVSQSALRPTSVHKAEKGDSEKTISELEAELGVVAS